MSGDSGHWFTVVQTVGIVSSFLFTAYQIQRSRRSSVAANEIRLIELHRDLWKMTIEKPDLMRPFDHALHGSGLTLSVAERRFVNLLFLHISGAYRLNETGDVKRTGDFRADMKELLVLPAIRKFWEENKRLYDPRFTAFVDSCVPLSLSEKSEE